MTESSEKKPLGVLIQSSYRVQCQNCGWTGNAVLGKEPIQAIELEANGMADWCPVCNAWAVTRPRNRQQ